MAILLGTITGCAVPLAEDGEGGDLGDELEAMVVEDQPAAATPFDELTVASGDVALCEDLVDGQRRCGEGFVTDTVDGCAWRFACARQLWRAEVADDVYRCVREQPCTDPDPGMTCLDEVAADLPPTDAQTRALRAVEAARERCGDVIDVAPGQVDHVYDAITSCLSDTTCDDLGACVIGSVESLVAEACGRPQTI